MQNIKKMLSNTQISEEYDRQKDENESLRFQLGSLIKKRLTDNNISLAFPIESRVKTLPSLTDKHNRDRSQGGIKIKQSINEVYDMVGLRIVVLYPDLKDIIVDSLYQLFEGNLEVKEVKAASTKEFSYTSSHLICSIPNKWQGSPTWESAKNKRFEIQVRTLSEHIWATLSHDLFYKKENIPEELERDLYKTKAILEICNDKIQDIKSTASQYFSKIESMPYENVKEQDLNTATFKRVALNYCPSCADMDYRWFEKWSSYIEQKADILKVSLLDDLLQGWDKEWQDPKHFIDELIATTEEYLLERTFESEK